MLFDFVGVDLGYMNSLDWSGVLDRSTGIQRACPRVTSAQRFFFEKHRFFCVTFDNAQKRMIEVYMRKEGDCMLVITAQIAVQLLLPIRTEYLSTYMDRVSNI